MTTQKTKLMGLPCPSHNWRKSGKRVVALFAAVATAWLTVYLVWYTPLTVYILDHLNLRPLFLPNILCPLCNNFTFNFVVDNRNFCTSTSGSDVFLLILVATFHANLDARQAIRASWGNVSTYRGQTIKTLFLFGLHDDKNYNYQVRYELENYGDVVQADFKDDYKWLTNKTMMGLTWAHRFCPSAKYVLKTDDDGFNVPQRFVDYLMNVRAPRFVGGYCFTVMPDRRDGSKFYVPYSMYPEQYYPTYCSGPGYVLSRLAVAEVLSVANNVIFLPMEDVFVSGICRVAAGIIYTQIVGVAEDQRQMTRCKLATWVKNGHNIYPAAVPPIWARVMDATRDKDCVGQRTGVFLGLTVFLVVWVKHIYTLTQLEKNDILEGLLISGKSNAKL